MVFILESGLMLLSFLFLFFFEQAKLDNLTPEIIGVLVFVFIVLSAGKRRKFALGGPAGVFILNTLIFLVIFSTGGLSSSFFFVLYFLIFAISFVFDPNLAFVFAAGSLMVFLPEALKAGSIESVVKIASLFIISPLAYFFGNMLKKEDQNQDDMVKIKEREASAADTISKDVAQVLQEEKQNLKPEDVDKLNEILEETQDLREEGKQ